MLKQVFLNQVFVVFALLAGTGFSLSGDALSCGAERSMSAVKYAQTETRWCCCGGCCGYARDCSIIPGCSSC